MRDFERVTYPNADTERLDFLESHWSLVRQIPGVRMDGRAWYSRGRDGRQEHHTLRQAIDAAMEDGE
jgi:hypothetical protein